MFDEDMSVFFSLGDPGIEEATHIDSNGESHPLIGEFLNNSESHHSGNKHINQNQPAFKLPAIDGQAVEVDDVLEIDGLSYLVSERLEIANGICLLYLVKEKQGGTGPHRWN